ncbi:MAG: hypothetical protein M1821_006390 [Bathelium mastoideum]|nr:MAG: hypothetical protein M1821_006390 [Bathelium mastoideum]KAI9693668.1 MAG: hypothetical protein M1822_002939 [Bathelium mastoideum]
MAGLTEDGTAVQISDKHTKTTNVISTTEGVDKLGEDTRAAEGADSMAKNVSPLRKDGSTGVITNSSITGPATVGNDIGSPATSKGGPIGRRFSYLPGEDAIKVRRKIEDKDRWFGRVDNQTGVQRNDFQNKKFNNHRRDNPRQRQM